MKLDKELLTKHAKRLQAILSEKSTFAPYIARPDFSKVLENSLNTLNAAEKKLTNVELASKLSAKTLVKEFNKLGKNTFKLDEKFKYGDEGDLIDNINYLFTYCNNIFKVNVDALVEGKNVVASNPTIDLKAKPEPEEMSGAAYAGMGMGMGMDAAYGNPFVMGKASAQLKQDIAAGKIYIYKSKPRIMPILKIIASALMMLTSIALIIMAIFAFQSGGLKIKSLDGQTTGTLQSAATGSGVLYILIACFGAYPIFTCLKGLFKNNENAKYYFNWPWILMFVIMILAFVLLDLSRTWLLPSRVIILDATSTAAYKAHNMWNIMFAVTLGMAGLCLIPMIIGAVLNPKQDQSIIERKLKEYADQAIASSGFGVPPVTPSAPAKSDVQKPVEVKKTDSKSKSKSKDKK